MKYFHRKLPRKIDLSDALRLDQSLFFERSGVHESQGAFAELCRDTETHTGTMGDSLAATVENGKMMLEAAARKLEIVVEEHRSLPVREYIEF